MRAMNSGTVTGVADHGGWGGLHGLANPSAGLRLLRRHRRGWLWGLWRRVRRATPPGGLAEVDVSVGDGSVDGVRGGGPCLG